MEVPVGNFGGCKGWGVWGRSNGLWRVSLGVGVKVSLGGLEGVWRAWSGGSGFLELI